MKGILCLVLCMLRLAQSGSTEDFTEQMRRILQEVNVSDIVLPETVQRVGSPYDCDLTATEPTTVHNLSPQYVDAVGAMGDSVTAAFAAGEMFLLEYRGVSWTIGGDNSLAEVLTVPNLIREFNPDLKGFSTGSGNTTANSPTAGLNVAVSGARTVNILDQAMALVTKMEELGITDDDWKVISIWIGGNDLCGIREGDPTPEELADTYVSRVEDALDYLKDNVPRAFVNLMLMLDVSKLDVFEIDPVCGNIHKLFCNGVANPDTKADVAAANQFYNDKLTMLVESGKYDTTDDFTVVLQPFFTETDIPLTEEGIPDNSYFSLDCFHFSPKGHAIGARYVWNNMFEPIGQKTNSIDWNDPPPLACPVENPYFATSANSGDIAGCRLQDKSGDSFCSHGNHNVPYRVKSEDKKA